MARDDIRIDLKEKRIDLGEMRINFDEIYEEKASVREKVYEKIIYIDNSDIDQKIQEYQEGNRIMKFMVVTPILKKFWKDFKMKKNKFYCMRIVKMKKNEKAIRRLMEKYIIHDINEMFSGPPFLLIKTGQVRLVVDYRELNNYIADNVHAMPSLKEVLQNV